MVVHSSKFIVHSWAGALRTSFLALLIAVAGMLTTSCEREPELHLHEGESSDIKFKPVIDLNLEVYWDYELIYGIAYDWKAEWFYDWDPNDVDDIKVFGDTLGYKEPTMFQIRRYHTGNTAYAAHKRPLEDIINGYHYRAKYDWGFWDMLLWNDIHTIDGVQSLIFDESSTYEYVTAYTNQSMVSAPYHAPKYTHAFYQPEPLFAAYERGIEINKNMDGFVFDAENNVYVKTLNMQLEPITYIYLTQVIIHNNRGKITGVDGSSNLSGMARSTRVNDGVAGSDQISVNYNVRFKKNCDMKGESVDIIGGRLLTFGMCNVNANRIAKSTRHDVVTRYDDGIRHYMDVKMQFLNGKDTTLIFDVTDQVQTRYKGGVLTVELDADTLKIPVGHPGGGFDAVVKDFDEVEFPPIELAPSRRGAKANNKTIAPSRNRATEPSNNRKNKKSKY